MGAFIVLCCHCREDYKQLNESYPTAGGISTDRFFYWIDYAQNDRNLLRQAQHDCKLLTHH